jgi:trehalose-phosphatase
MKPADLAELSRLALSKNSLWLFLDYDGTLAEFAPTPQTVAPVPQVVDLLKRLASKVAVRLTVISGRRLDDLRRLLPVPGIYLAGTYGLDLQTPQGVLIQRADFIAIRPILEKIKPQWQEILGDQQGFFLEDKGWALALHARFAEDDDADQVLALAREIVEHNLPEELFRILGGHKFLEVAPVAAHKGQTVEYLLANYPLPDALLLYVGDDDKDEQAFTAIHAHHGLAVKVTHGSQETQHTEADYLLDSPADVNAWLEFIVSKP